MARKRSNGEGTIRENKTRNRWEARYVAEQKTDGTLVRRMVTGRTRKEVVAKLQEAQGAAISGEVRAQADLTVGRFLDQWATDVLPGSVAPTTEQQYKDVIRLYIRPKLGRKRLVSLNARDVSQMVRSLADEGKSPNTQRLARSILRRALRFAEQDGAVARNAAAISFGVRVPKPEGRTMTVDEARCFLTSIEPHRLSAAWVTMLTLGLRRGELLGLDWSDLTLTGDRPTLKVRRSMKRLPAVGLHLSEPKTTTSMRTVELPPITMAALRSHQVEQKTERLKAGAVWDQRPLGFDLVFRTELGTAVDPDNFRNMTYRLTEAAGLGSWSPHELRHCAASLLIAMGVPMKTISETLGHSSIRVTADVYGHLFEEARTEAANAMQKALG